MHAEESAPRATALRRAGAELVRLPGAGGRVDLPRLLAVLGEREVNEVMVECGPTLAGALLAAGLIDELVLYVAPLLLGEAARGLFALPAITRMNERVALRILSMDPVGRDWRLRVRPAP